MKAFIRIAIRIQECITNLTQTGISIIRIILFSRSSTTLPKPSNKTVSILGNGPSLKWSLENQFEWIESTEVICVNNFASTEYYVRLKPQNYVLLDPAYFTYSEKNLDRGDIKKTFHSIFMTTNWPINVYVPQQAKKSNYFKAFAADNPNIKLIYFNYTIFEGFDFFKYFLFSKRISMPQSENVLVAALFLMISRNFEYIYIFGADHSWHEQIQIRDDNMLTLKDVHFYNPDVEKESERVLYNASEKQKVSISKQFRSFSKAFRGYDILAGYAKYKNVKVYNASEKSYVDAFDRIKLK